MTLATLQRPDPGFHAAIAGQPAIATQGLVKRYGRQTALAGVDLTAPEGGVYLLAGANGAGKSSLLRILLNLLAPSDGAATVLGLDSRRDGPAIRAEVGYVPETHQIGYRWMTVGRLMDHLASYYPRWDQTYADQLARRLDLQPHSRLGNLSKGQARRMQLIAALARRPRLLLLDEPTDGLDPAARDEVMGLIAEHLADTGCTVLVSTHLIYEVERIADHVGVLRAGELAVQMPREALQAKLRLYRATGPEGWVGPTDLTGVMKRAALGREVHWTVWGEEREVVARMTDSGGVVRDASPLSLDEAVVTLMRAKDQ